MGKNLGMVQEVARELWVFFCSSLCIWFCTIAQLLVQTFKYFFLICPYSNLSVLFLE